MKNHSRYSTEKNTETTYSLIRRKYKQNYIICKKRRPIKKEKVNSRRNFNE